MVARTGPEVDVEVDGGEHDLAWATRELRSIVGHRQASDYDRGDGAHEKRLAASAHVLGELVELGDSLESSYRVSDDEISTVTRTLGERRLTIVVHERLHASDGTGLPTSFSVFYWDAASGALASAEAYRDVPVDVEGILLPASRTIVRGASDGLAVRSLELTGHELVAGDRS